MEFVLNHVVPACGVILAHCIWFSSMKSVLQVKKSKDIGDLNVLPFGPSLMNTICWVAYGIIVQDWYLLLANTTGVVIALFYLLVTIRYTKEHVFDQMISILLFGSSSFIIITVILTFFDWSFQTIDLVATLHANFWLMLLYASPMSTIGQVIKMKSSASLEFKLCLAFVLNGSLWFVYGLVIQNYGVCIPNGIGALLSMVQLALCFIYPNEEDELSSSYPSDHNQASPPTGNTLVDMLPHKPSLSENKSLMEEGQASPSAAVV